MLQAIKTGKSARRLTEGSLIPPNQTFLNQNRFQEKTMAKDKVNMPMSTAGLTRYFEDYKSKIEFKPGYVVLFSILVIIIIALLHFLLSAKLGV